MHVSAGYALVCGKFNVIGLEKTARRVGPFPCYFPTSPPQRNRRRQVGRTVQRRINARQGC